MANTDMEKVTGYVEPSTKRRLILAAKLERRSMAGLIDWVIGEYLDRAGIEDPGTDGGPGQRAA